MSEIRIGKMVLGMVQTNTYFVYREGEKRAVCVDPADQGEKILAALESKGFAVCVEQRRHFLLCIYFIQRNIITDAGHEEILALCGGEIRLGDF